MPSFADHALATKIMLEGLKANTDLLTAWGFETAFLTNLDKAYQDALVLNGEQQALKSRLKEKTASVDETTRTMLRMQRKARHLVKTQLPQESWKEFGVTAKR